MIPALPQLSQLPPWLLLCSGALLGWLRSFWTALYNRTFGQVIQRITVSVTVEEMDHPQAWVWLNYWVEKRLKERRISALLLRKADHGFDDSELKTSDGRADVGYELAPAYGVYPFFWRKRYILVFDSGKKDQQGTPAPGSGGLANLLPRRQATLTIWGTRDRNLLLGIIAEAQSEWEAGHPAALHYFFHRYSYWNSRPMPPRPMSTVYLPGDMIGDVLKDARQFLKSKARYEPMGIPWRRGYLFYGPPGGGKTTLVQAVATELNLPLYYLSLAAVRSREDLANLLDNVRPGSIVLIEDVDCIAAAAERMSGDADDDDDKKPIPPTGDASKITPSDLLNYIDGIIASQGRILVMTTNYPEKLDRALTRAGRVDRKWEITYAEQKQLLKFHAAAVACEMTEISVHQFLAMLPSPATIADAQAILFRGSAAENDVMQPQVK
jgi:ATPase family associated with various cellular activities (AAA)/BCS1 N terminal